MKPTLSKPKNATTCSAWLPLDPDKLRNTGGNSKSRLAVRVFGLDGKPFPRLVISIWNAAFEDGLKIAASKKNKAGEWWGESTIPAELLPAVREMIDEILKQNDKDLASLPRVKIENTKNYQFDILPSLKEGDSSSREEGFLLQRESPRRT